MRRLTKSDLNEDPKLRDIYCKISRGVFKREDFSKELPDDIILKDDKLWAAVGDTCDFKGTIDISPCKILDTCVDIEYLPEVKAYLYDLHRNCKVYTRDLAKTKEELYEKLWFRLEWLIRNRKHKESASTMAYWVKLGERYRNAFRVKNHGVIYKTEIPQCCWDCIHIEAECDRWGDHSGYWHCSKNTFIPTKKKTCKRQKARKSK